MFKIMPITNIVTFGILVPTITILFRAKKDGSISFNILKMYITIMFLEVIILVLLLLLPK